LATGTLPGDDHKLAVPEALDRMRGVWRRFIDALRRAYPYLSKVPWLAVMEPHKSGIPHMHIVLAMRFFSVQVMQRFWTYAGGGNLDLKRRVEGNGKAASGIRAAWYALKYISKGGDWPPDARQYFHDTTARQLSMSRVIQPLEKTAVPAGWSAWYLGQDKVHLVVELIRQHIEVGDGSPWSAPPAPGPVDDWTRDTIDEWILEYAALPRLDEPALKPCPDWEAFRPSRLTGGGQVR